MPEYRKRFKVGVMTTYSIFQKFPQNPHILKSRFSEFWMKSRSRNLIRSRSRRLRSRPVIAWLESRFLMTLTRLESRWERWWLDSTRVTFFTEWLDSSHNQRLESESFLQNLRASDRQTQFVCIQRNDRFWSSNDQNWCKFSVLTFKSCYTIS